MLSCIVVSRSSCLHIYSELKKKRKKNLASGAAGFCQGVNISVSEITPSVYVFQAGMDVLKRKQVHGEGGRGGGAAKVTDWL